MDRDNTKKSEAELIKEIENLKLEKGIDYFSEMFRLQKKLQDFYGKSYDSLTLEERAKYVRDNWCYLTGEVGELFDIIPYYKFWKDYKGKDTLTKEEKAAILLEFVDMLHFMLNIAIYLGLEPEEIIKGYIVKNRENKERKKRGY